MRKRTRSILQELSSINRTSNNDALIQSTGNNLIESSINLLIDNKNNSSEKIFYEEFSYKNKDNKFDLSEYEIKLENDLIDKIIEDKKDQGHDTK